jgi:hypothetical protein
LLLWFGGLPARPGATRLLSLDQRYFRQIISGTNDNKTTVSVIPTMLFSEWGTQERDANREQGQRSGAKNKCGSRDVAMQPVAEPRIQNAARSHPDRREHPNKRDGTVNPDFLDEVSAREIHRRSIQATEKRAFDSAFIPQTTMRPARSRFDPNLTLANHCLPGPNTSGQRKVPSLRSQPATFTCLPCCVFCDAVLAARKAEGLNYQQEHIAEARRKQ